MKGFILGIIGGLLIGMMFLGIISVNDDKIIEYEQKKTKKCLKEINRLNNLINNK